MSVSVLMSICKGENPEQFRVAVRSVWDDQIRKPNEIILVEDGALAAELKSVVDEWKRRLGAVIKIVALPENVGLGAALNEGLKYCTQEFVARMDADDISLPARFEKQLSWFLSNPGLDVVGGFSIEIDDAGNRGKIRVMPVTHESIMASLWACPFIHPAVMYRRSKLLEVGGYDSSLRRRQDYELWFRCARHGMRFHNIPEPVILYRFNKKTHTKQSSKLALQQALIGYKGAASLGLAWWKRAACFIPYARSFLPLWLQHFVYDAMRSLDPRRRRGDL